MAKNRFFLAGILGIALVFGLAGCKNDSDGGGDNGGGGSSIPSALHGTWKKLDADADTTLKFTADKVHITTPTGDAGGKEYSVDISGKTIKYGNGGEVSTWATLCTDYTITGNQLIISGNVQYNKTSILNGTYTKQ